MRNVAIAVTTFALFMVHSEALSFETVITIHTAGSQVPAAIGSNTQLNVSGKASLPATFTAGLPNGTSTNVELNFSGQQAENILAYDGSTLNLSGGVIWKSVQAFEGSTVNFLQNVQLRGGFHAWADSTINVGGGTLLPGSHAYQGSQVNLTGGVLRRFTAMNGSEVNVFGGTLGEKMSFRDGSQLRLYGEDFRIDGIQVAGLRNSGDSIQLDLSEGALLSGTLSDGTPFALSKQDRDEIASGSLQLLFSPAPPSVPGAIAVSNESNLSAVRDGQNLTILPGGTLRDQFSAGRGSVVDVTGGTVGYYFEAVGAKVTISGGVVGNDFDAFHGSKIHISGGQVGANFHALNGSEVQVVDGAVGPYFRAEPGSRVEITGGKFGKWFTALERSSVDIGGGEFGERFLVYAGGSVTISGGSFDKDFRAYDGSEINLRGTEFLIDGHPIEQLQAGVPKIIAERDVMLTGILADGSPFEFELNTIDWESQPWSLSPLPYDLFAANSVLSITLVPEPSGAAVLAITLASLISGFGRHVRKKEAFSPSDDNPAIEI